MRFSGSGRNASLFVLDALLEGGGNVLGVVDEAVPVQVFCLQDRVHQEGQLLVL